MKIWFLVVTVLFLNQSGNAAILNVVRGKYDSGKLYVPCTFDSFSETCFIDTGATFSSVANMKQFESYPTTGTIRFKGASGLPIEADEIMIKNLDIGTSIINSVKVARLNSKDGFESVIGINAINCKPFSFQFRPAPSLDLDAVMPMHSTTGLELYEKGIFSIPVHIGSSKNRGLWDTGAGLTSIDINYVNSNPDEFIFVKDILNGSDATGNPVVMRLYKAKNLVIGKHVFKNECFGHKF